MDPEELSWRRRRARARGGQTRVSRGGRGAAAVASRCCLRFLGLLLSSPGLLVLVVSYCFLGAWIFRFLETEEETEVKTAVEKYREDCIKELWHITERLNVLYEKNWTALVNEQLRLFEISVMSVTEAEAHDYGSQSGPQKQSFVRALFYSVAIMTTIGFGKISPKTATSKVVVMVFAGFGIPITMICLVYLGTLLAEGFQSAYAAFLPGITAEILSPLTDKIECKSHPSQEPNPSEIEDSEEDLRQPSEVSYSRGNLKLGRMYKETTKPTRRSNSMMLTTMNLALEDYGQNLTRSSERHSLLVECEMCAVEQNAANYTNKKVGEDIGDSSVANIHEDEVRKSIEASDQMAHAQCSLEDRNNDQDHHHHMKEWNSEHHNTPSRIPLIGKDVTQPSHCLQHNMAETKYLWNTSFSMQPPPPASSRCPSRRGHCSKYDQDSSPLAGSDRNLCSTPSLAAIPMDLSSSNQAKLPVWLILGVLGAYILIGAAIFASWEGWAYVDSAFFCFMLLSTVGFGDFVPGYSPKAWNSIQSSWKSTPGSPNASVDARVLHPWTLTSCCVYLIFGIILVASIIILIQRKWGSYIHSLRESLCTLGNEHMEGEDSGEVIDTQDEARDPSFNQFFHGEHQ